jgi:hypothetical protein
MIRFPPINSRLTSLLVAICPFLFAFSWSKYEGHLHDKESNAPIESALVVAQWEECAGFGHCNSFCVHSEIAKTDSSGKFSFKAWSNDAPKILFYKLGYKTVTYIPLGHVDAELRFLKKSDINGRKYLFSQFTGTPEKRLEYLRSISVDCSSKDSNGNMLPAVYEKILDEAKQYIGSKDYKRTLLHICTRLGYASIQHSAVKVPHPTEDQATEFLKKNKPECRIATFTYKNLQGFEQAVQHNDVGAMQRYFTDGLEMENLHGGQHAILLAADRGHYEAMELLLEHGADPRGSEKNSSSAIFYLLNSRTTASRKEKILSLLVSHGVLLNGKNENNQTLLELAMYRNDANIVKMLIDNGVDISNLRVSQCDKELYNMEVPAGTSSIPIKLGTLLPDGSKLRDGSKINGACRLNEEILSERVSQTSKKLFSEKKVRGNKHLFRITVDCDRARLKSIYDKLSADEIRVVEYEYMFEVNARQKAKALINTNEMEKSVRQCIIEQYYKDVTFDSRPGSEENIFIKVSFPAILAKGVPPKIPARAN